MLLALTAAVLSSTAFASSPPALPEGPPDPSRILGRWRGLSECLVRDGRCRDETVRYAFGPAAGKLDSVRLAADRLREGRWVPMYEVNFGWNAATRRWDCVYATPRLRIHWSYEVRRDSLFGTLTSLPDRTLLRRVRAARVGP